METDVDPLGIALGEILAREHLRHRLAGGELDDVHEAHRAKPFAVVADFEVLRVGQEDLADLGDVGLGVGVDLLAGEDFAGLVPAGRIAHAGGVVADDQDGLVAPLLELPDDLERHGMAKRHIGRGRVHAELDAQGLAGLSALVELRLEVLLAEDPLGPAGQHADLFFECGHISPIRESGGL